MQKITPNTWFNKNAGEAVNLYTSVFPDSKINRTTHYGKEGYEFHQMPEGSVLTIDYELMGQKFLALNGGSQFPLNPSVSFMVMCTSEAEVDGYWSKLSEGGTVMMALDKYDWSPKYGWCSDKFGVSWQLYLADSSFKGQRIVPTLMFTGENAGHAEEAINLYTSVFEDSKIEGILKYEEGDGDTEGFVKHAQFDIHNYTLMAMDSSHSHGFTFNESFSLIVHCKNQAEVDKYWNALTADGGRESQCGWLKDKFGLSWQIVPDQLVQLMSNPDKQKAGRATQAMMKMKKLIVEELENA